MKAIWVDDRKVHFGEESEQYLLIEDIVEVTVSITEVFLLILPLWYEQADGLDNYARACRQPTRRL